MPFGEKGFIVAEEDENFVIVAAEMIYDFRNKNIENKSFVEIGKIYNVSDNAVRKWCKIYKYKK